MTWTRLSLYYLCGYLLVGGPTLLVFPVEGLRLLLSNGDYGDIMPRVVGMLMTGFRARGFQYHRDTHRGGLRGDARRTSLLPDLHRCFLYDDAGPVVSGSASLSGLASF